VSKSESNCKTFPSALGFTGLPASTLQKCKKLGALVLNNNKLTSVSHIGHLSALNTLVLSHNRIERMPKSLLEDLPQLAKLSLSGNQLNKFPSVWMCEQMIELRLAGNLITDIPAKVSRMSKLRLLDMSNNSLASFDEMAHLGKCERLTNVAFRGNPLAGGRAGDAAAGAAASAPPLEVDAGTLARYASQVSLLLPHVIILDGNRLSGNARGKRGQAAPADAVAQKRRRQGLGVDQAMLEQRGGKAKLPRLAAPGGEDGPEASTNQEQARVAPGQHPGMQAVEGAAAPGNAKKPKKDKKPKKAKAVVTDIHMFSEDPGEAPMDQPEVHPDAASPPSSADAAVEVPALTGALGVTDEAAKNARRHKKDKKGKQARPGGFVPAVAADAGVGLIGAAAW
jgi:hypothetical protein